MSQVRDPAREFERRIKLARLVSDKIQSENNNKLIDTLSDADKLLPVLYLVVAVMNHKNIPIETIYSDIQTKSGEAYTVLIKLKEIKESLSVRFSSFFGVGVDFKKEFGIDVIELNKIIISTEKARGIMALDKVSADLKNQTYAVLKEMGFNPDNSKEMPERIGASEIMRDSDAQFAERLEALSVVVEETRKMNRVSL